MDHSSCVIHATPIPRDPQVETLQDFGNANTQTLAELVWDFFEYWAWGHDYRSTVISVRTAGTLTKTEKGWAQRVGRERHLVRRQESWLIGMGR